MESGRRALRVFCWSPSIMGVSLTTCLNRPSKRRKAVSNVHRLVALVVMIGASLLGTTASGADTGLVETDLVCNRQVNSVPTLTDKNGVVHVAKFFDPNLVNPWGVGESAGSPFWVSDNGSGVASLYNTPGPPQSLVVAAPPPRATTPVARRRHPGAGRPAGGDGGADGPRLQRGPSAESLRDLGRDGRRCCDYRPGRLSLRGRGRDDPGLEPQRQSPGR